MATKRDMLNLLVERYTALRRGTIADRWIRAEHVKLLGQLPARRAFGPSLDRGREWFELHRYDNGGVQVGFGGLPHPLPRHVADDYSQLPVRPAGGVGEAQQCGEFALGDDDPGVDLVLAPAEGPNRGRREVGAGLIAGHLDRRGVDLSEPRMRSVVMFRAAAMLRRDQPAAWAELVTEASLRAVHGSPGSFTDRYSAKALCSMAFWLSGMNACFLASPTVELVPPEKPDGSVMRRS